MPTEFNIPDIREAMHDRIFAPYRPREKIVEFILCADCQLQLIASSDTEISRH